MPLRKVESDDCVKEPKKKQAALLAAKACLDFVDYNRGYLTNLFFGEGLKEIILASFPGGGEIFIRRVHLCYAGINTSMAVRRGAGRDFEVFRYSLDSREKHWQLVANIGSIEELGAITPHTLQCTHPRSKNPT